MGMDWSRNVPKDQERSGRVRTGHDSCKAGQNSHQDDKDSRKDSQDSYKDSQNIYIRYICKLISPMFLDGSASQ